MASDSAYQATSSKIHGLGIDQLWLLVILAGFGIFVSLTPLVPNDFWWHLKIGQLTYQNGVIPNTNLFAWSLPADTPFHIRRLARRIPAIPPLPGGQA